MKKNSLKNKLLATLFCTGLASISVANASNVWVSDEIEAPLRSNPELNSQIIAMLPAGQRVQKLDSNKDYVKVKTSDGKTGWLSGYYVLNTTSVHDQLVPTKKALEKAEAELKALKTKLTQQDSHISELTAAKNQMEQTAADSQELSSNNSLLQKKLSEQSAKMAELAKALDVANEKASTARTQYLSLVKVSENVVEIDKQNQSLQKQAVQFEQEVQQLKNENQNLKAQLNTRQTIVTALLIFGGVLVGYILSVLMPPRGSRSSSYPSL